MPIRQIVTAIIFITATTASQAQQIKCVTYLKANKQAQAEMSGISPSTGDKTIDAQLAALTAKMRSYCQKYPSADLAKAIEETMN